MKDRALQLVQSHFNFLGLLVVLLEVPVDKGAGKGQRGQTAKQRFTAIAVKFIEPLLPTLVDAPPQDDEWIHEIKFDGYRTQLQLCDGEGRAYTSNGHDWSHLYWIILEEALKLPCETAIIDGEVIIQDEQGRCDFHGLRRAIQKEPDALLFMAFDLLELDGQPPLNEPIERRRGLLEKLIGPMNPASPLHFSASVIGDGQSVFAAADRMGLEGIVSKRRGSPYRSGYSDKWVKTKAYTEEELIVVGTEQGDGPTVALLAREKGGKLEYAGGAMLTLRQAERERFWQAVEALKRATPVLPLKSCKKATWTEPEMRVRVRTLPGEEKLRHANVLEIVRLPKR